MKTRTWASRVIARLSSRQSRLNKKREPERLPILLNFGELLSVIFDVNNLTALIVSTVGADTVGQSGFAAVGADHNIASLERIMRPAAVSATR
jgi:hypothetical protein